MGCITSNAKVQALMKRGKSKVQGQLPTAPTAVYYPDCKGIFNVDKNKPFAQDSQPMSLDLFIWAAVNNPQVATETTYKNSNNKLVTQKPSGEELLNTMNAGARKAAKLFFAKHPFFHLKHLFKGGKEAEAKKVFSSTPVWGPYEWQQKHAFYRSVHQNEGRVEGSEVQWTEDRIIVTFGSGWSSTGTVKNISVTFEDGWISVSQQENSPKKSSSSALFGYQVMPDGQLKDC